LEKSRPPQCACQHHHPQQQGDRVEIDRGIGLFQRQRAAADHQHPAHERHPGAVEPQPRQPSERHAKIGQQKDRNGQTVDDGGGEQAAHERSHRTLSRAQPDHGTPPNRYALVNGAVSLM
jgi:hypothetical protein